MTDGPAATRWWSPERHAARRPYLLARNRIKAALQGWLEREGFLVVDTAALQVSPGNETHLHAFATEAIGSDLSRRPLYLATSPEFAMKKLLAAGETRIAAFAPAYRNRERGRLHHPEFTMLEWYRAGEPYQRLWDDCGALLALAAETAGVDRLTWRGRAADPRRPAARVTLAEAFAEHAGIDLLATVKNGDGDASALGTAARAAGLDIPPDYTWSDTFSRVLVERVEPALAARPEPVVLCEYPVIEAALARVSPGDPRVAERFELYACGVELANGFGELTDPVEQRRRFEADMADKQRLYGERYPLDEDFLAALPHMPPASGVALGFERLVMLATGAPAIEDVIWTPVAQ